MCIAFLNSVSLGFSIGRLYTILQDVPQGTYNPTTLNVLFQFIAVPGAVTNAVIGDAYGRRLMFLQSGLCMCLGPLLCSVSVGRSMLIPGTWAIAWGLGSGLVVHCVYTAELAPADRRGLLICLTDAGMSIGILLVSVVDYLIDEFTQDVPTQWRLQFAVGASCPLVLLAVGALWLPESPRWLLMHWRWNDCTDVLVAIHACSTTAKKVVFEIARELTHQQPPTPTWSAFWNPDASTKHILFISLTLAVAQQICGPDVVSGFFAHNMTADLREKGWSERQCRLSGVLLLGALKIGANLLAASMVDHKGRRPLLLWSAAGNTISLLFLAGFYTDGEGLALSCMASVCFFEVAFSMGIGPICWIGVVEFFPTTMRARGVALAAAANRCACGILTLIWQNNISWLGINSVFFNKAILSVFVFIFIYLYIPETKQSTIEKLSHDIRTHHQHEAGC